MERVPTENEIDNSIRMLAGNYIATLPQLDFLMKSWKRPGMCSEREDLLRRISTSLRENFREGYFFRWDIDPWDAKRDTQPLSSVPECPEEIEYWLRKISVEVKNGILTAIASFYRSECKNTVIEYSDRFRCAQRISEIMDVVTDAVTEGVLIRVSSGQLSHNHSFVNSKMAMKAYSNAINSVP